MDYIDEVSVDGQGITIAPGRDGSHAAIAAETVGTGAISHHVQNFHWRFDFSNFTTVCKMVHENPAVLYVKRAR